MHKHSLNEVQYRRVEVITCQKRWRDWTAEEKAETLAATMVPGAAMTEMARRFDVSRSLVCIWRRKAMGELAGEVGPRFVLLRIEEAAGESTAVIAQAPRSSGRDQTAGSIEIEIGRARVRVEGSVDSEVLLQVLGLIGSAQ